MKAFGVRFTSPVKPGDELETQVWEIGPGPNGTTELTFVTKDVTSGKVSADSCPMIPSFMLIVLQVALGNGVAFIKKAEKSKL